VKILHLQNEPCPLSQLPNSIPVVRVNNSLWEMTGHCVDSLQGDWYVLVGTSSLGATVEITLEQELNSSKWLLLIVIHIERKIHHVPTAVLVMDNVRSMEPVRVILVGQDLHVKVSGFSSSFTHHE
jgi:hypothetical protein